MSFFCEEPIFWKMLTRPSLHHIIPKPTGPRSWIEIVKEHLTEEFTPHYPLSLRLILKFTSALSRDHAILQKDFYCPRIG